MKLAMKMNCKKNKTINHFLQTLTLLIIKIKATLKNFQKENLELLKSRVLSFNKNNIIDSNYLLSTSRKLKEFRLH